MSKYKAIFLIVLTIIFLEALLPSLYSIALDMESNEELVNEIEQVADNSEGKIELNSADSGETEEKAIVSQTAKRKYLFGGSEDISWTGYWTGGTWNPGPGETTINSEYLEVKTWSTWVSHAVGSADEVDLSEYDRIVFEFSSVSRSWRICGGKLWVCRYFISLSSND